MSKSTNPKNLIELLLFQIRKKPGMYLGEAKLYKLTNFITGYSMCCNFVYKIEESYFGDNGFLEWYYKTYNVVPDSSWESPFLNEANGDEAIALDIYFNYLEKYYLEITNSNKK